MTADKWEPDIPKTCCTIAADPHKGMAHHLFGYTNADPLNYVDPSGRNAMLEHTFGMANATTAREALARRTTMPSLLTAMSMASSILLCLHQPTAMVLAMRELLKILAIASSVWWWYASWQDDPPEKTTADPKAFRLGMVYVWSPDRSGLHGTRMCWPGIPEPNLGRASGWVVLFSECALIVVSIWMIARLLSQQPDLKLGLGTFIL